MTEEQAQLIEQEIARIREANRNVPWFHGREAERHLCMEIADFVLCGMRGTEDAKAEPAPRSATDKAYWDGFQQAIDDMHAYMGERFPPRARSTKR